MKTFSSSFKIKVHTQTHYKATWLFFLPWFLFFAHGPIISPCGYIKQSHKNRAVNLQFCSEYYYAFYTQEFNLSGHFFMWADFVRITNMLFFHSASCWPWHVSRPLMLNLLTAQIPQHELIIIPYHTHTYRDTSIKLIRRNQIFFEKRFQQK